MTRRAKIIWGIIAAFGLLGIAFVGLAFYEYQIQMRPLRAVATSFRPECSSRDPSCGPWTTFRQRHPYPYQTIAVRLLPDATRVVILSEPAPVINSKELNDLATSIFGSDLLDAKRLRWNIGADGW